MTIQEFHRSFKFRVGKLDALNAPNILPEEIDLLLNQALDAIVKQRYGVNNLKGTSFEQDQKRDDDLRELVRTVREAPVQFNRSVENVTHNAINFVLPENYWFLIWEKAILDCETCNTEVTIPIKEFGEVDLGRTQTIFGVEAEVRPISHTQLEKVYKDAFKKPSKDKILRLQYKDRVELIPSTDCSILYYIYRYIKKPERMSLSGNVTCELADHMHEEVLNEAVSIALEGIESKRIQTFNPLVNNKDE